MTADDTGTDLPQLSAADDAFVRDLLSALPPVPVPADLADRLDTAIRTAAVDDPSDVPAAAVPTAGTTVVALDDARARSLHRRTRVLQVAAAVVLLGAGVLGVVKIAGSDSAVTASTGAGAPAASVPSVPTSLMTRSGHAYTDATLVSDVRALVGHKSLSGNFGSNAGGTGQPATPTPGVSESLRTPSSVPSAHAGDGSGGVVGGDTAVSSEAGLVACLAAVEVGAKQAVTPLAVDEGQYRGQPALVVVLPGSQHPQTSYDVFVVGIACGQNDDAHLLTYQLVEAH